MHRVFKVLLVSCVFVVAAWARADMPAAQQNRLNNGAVGIITGGVTGTYIRIAADLAVVLDSDDLRILPILGKGSVQNVLDLLYLRGVDIAIVQSDVLEYFRQQREYRNLPYKIHYVSKLYNEEFHLLTKGSGKSVADLADQKVNVDVEGSGTAMTAGIIFKLMNIKVEPTHFDQALALDKLKRGEIAALAYVAGKPAQLFRTLPAGEDLHFLSITPTPDLIAAYFPARLNHADYPNLMAEGEEVGTLAVGAVMAVYNWQKDRYRLQKVERFVNRFFDRLGDLQQPSRHPKWQEISLSATVPGWTRSPAAERWLKRSGNAPSQSPIQ